MNSIIQINYWEIFIQTLRFLFLLWPFWLLLLGLLGVKLFFEIALPKTIRNWRNRNNFVEGEKWRGDRERLQWLRNMKPKEFEEYIADLFSRLGYKAHAVGKSHDGGIDVIAEKDGVKNYIQCKKYTNKTVSVGALRDFYGALADRIANGKSYFITTYEFTLEAVKFAEDKPIELVDQFKLLKYIKLTEQQENKEKISLPSKICPKCGAELIEKHGKFGKFWGCSTYPKCHFTESIDD
jgi:restriction system protein